MNNNFYVYVYLNMTKPGNFEFDHKYGKGWMYAPFYVGKGKNKRMYDHIKETRKFYSSVKKPKKYNYKKLKSIKNHFDINITPVVLLVDDKLSNQEALDLEKILIKHLGRLDIGTGILTNGTDGGIGGDTWVGLNEQERKIRKEKLSKSLIGKGGKYTRTETVKNKIKTSVKKYYQDDLVLLEHSNKTKKGLAEKGYTSEVISKLTKEGMKNVPYEKLAYWKGKKQKQKTIDKRSESVRKNAKLKRKFDIEILVDTYLLNINLNKMVLVYNRNKPPMFPILDRHQICYNLLDLFFPLGAVKKVEGKIDSPKIKKNFIKKFDKELYLKEYANGDFS